MSIKQIILAVGVLLILGIGSMMVLDTSWEGAGSGVGDKVLTNVPVNDITKIVIKQKDKTVTLQRVDGVWSVVEKGGYAADFQKIRSAVLKLRDLRVAKVINAAPKAYGRLELDDEHKTVITCFDKSNGVVTELSLGKEAESKRQPQQQMYFAGSSNGRYVLAKGAVKPVLISDALYQFSTDGFSWINRDFLSVEKVKSIRMKDNWQVSRKEGNSDFELASEIPEGKEVDGGNVSSLSSAFNYLSFDDVKKSSDEKVDKSIEIMTFDGFVYTFDFVKAKGDTFVKIAVKGDFAEKREPGKGEKPEDTAKLDEEFADNLTKLKEKLAKEQKFSGWLYKFSSSKNDAILKTLDDLLKDKEKEEKKEESKETK